MKKLLALILTAGLVIACLTACDLFEKDTGATCKEYENCAVFTFDNFPARETATFKISRTGLGEGTIYYQINLESGALSMSYKDTGFIHDEQPLGVFTADEDMPTNGSGGYIEGDKISITFKSDSTVTGEIIIAFTEEALKAVHGSLHQHEHTREMRSNEYAHWYVYTCGCETPDNSAKHSDADENYICDVCDYVMPGHEHVYEYCQDDIGHGWSYTCGCKTPPNFTQHFDGNGDGKCDENFCEYNMLLYSISYDEKITSEFLMSGYAPTEAKPGNTVKLRTYPLMDADLVLYANGVKLVQVYANYDFWEYIFTMPNDDVVITYEIVTADAPKNYFLRNQAGAEWLSEITPDEITQIKMISGGGGPLPPVSFTHITTSRNKTVISDIYEEYYWLDSKPVPEESTQIPDGGYFIVQFILNDESVKQLYFINGDFYHDGNGNYFELVRLPVLRDETNFVIHYGFEAQEKHCQIYLIDETFICEIPACELEFMELTDCIYLGDTAPTRYIEISGKKIHFIYEDYFYIGDDRSVYYQLVGKNLDELITEYGTKK